MKLTTDGLDRLMSGISKTPTDEGCLEWMRGKDNGYGRIRIDGKNHRVHRLVWEVYNMKSADGMMVCHSCDNPGCCNPLHLFLGTNQDNVKDCVRKRRHSEVRKTHCPRGHSYSGINLYILPSNDKRQCRICRNETMKKLRLKKKLSH